MDTSWLLVNFFMYFSLRFFVCTKLRENGDCKSHSHFRIHGIGIISGVCVLMEFILCLQFQLSIIINFSEDEIKTPKTNQIR